ncbi:hypothetical protein EYF80_021906 [Liparis tanakae]|uniref:Uncharacterized protein n=1 Tax=Liparis tanakae TaxID=230148 RepID=A0A4Z2HQD7_9TELE|nr:hypothetical protein EYF80_021906 [Liparis tanakae]
MLLTFPPEMLAPPPPRSRSPVVCGDGLGAISGLGLASGLRGGGDEAVWDASWTDMGTGASRLDQASPDRGPTRTPKDPQGSTRTPTDPQRPTWNMKETSPMGLGRVRLLQPVIRL